jgi:AcrR family transcriptional regulator
MRAVSKELVRATILDAAEVCLAQQGLDKARMDAVAQRAGVAVGTIYNYFGGRAQLVRAVLVRRNTELDNRLTRALETPTSFSTAVEVLVREVFEHCAEHAAFFSLLLQSEDLVARPWGHGEGMRIVLRHMRRIEQATTERAVARSEVSLESELTVGCIRGGILHVLERDGDTEQWRETASLVTRFVLARSA